MEQEILKSLEVLQRGGIIIYPTDTVWGIGCDATNTQAISKIYQLKKREAGKSLILLMDSLKMLQQYLPKTPAAAARLIKSNKAPITIVYNNPIGLASNAISDDHTVAIRIPSDPFCKQLIRKFGKPITATSANTSGKPTPCSFSEIDDTLLSAADHVVNLRRKEVTNSPSQIVMINTKGEIEVIRK